MSTNKLTFTCLSQQPPSPRATAPSAGGKNVINNDTG